MGPKGVQYFLECFCFAISLHFSGFSLKGEFAISLHFSGFSLKGELKVYGTFLRFSMMLNETVWAVRRGRI